MSRLRSILMASGASALCFVSGFLTIFAPMPLLSLALTRGLRFGVLASLLGVLLVLAFELTLGGWHVAQASRMIEATQSFRVVYYISLALLALMGAYGVRRERYTFYATLAISLATCLFLAWALVVQIASHGVFYAQWRHELAEFFQLVAREQTKGAAFGFETERMMSAIPKLAGWVADLFPALFYIYAAVVLSFNIGLARRIPKLHRVLANVRSIAQFRNPDYLIWVLLVAGFVFLGNEHGLSLSWLKLVSLNILLALLALYAAQGLGVWTSVLYFLRVRRFFRQVLFLVLVFSFQFALPLMVGVGLVDVWWDWRAKMRRTLKNS